MLTSVQWSEVVVGVILAIMAGGNVGLGSDAAPGWIVALYFYFHLLRSEGRRIEATEQLSFARRALLALKTEIEQDAAAGFPATFYRRADR